MQTRERNGSGTEISPGLGAFALKSDMVIHRHYTASGDYSCVFLCMYTGTRTRYTVTVEAQGNTEVRSC